MLLGSEHAHNTYLMMEWAINGQKECGSAASSFTVQQQQQKVEVDF